MFRALQRSGKLEQLVDSAVEQTWEAMERAVFDQKVPWDLAWEQLREEWMFLPSEEEVPRLGENPNTAQDLEWEE
jgi:hypothetical protein